MVFVPPYLAVSEEALIDNTLVLVETHFKPALDALYPAEASLVPGDPQYLDDFRERALGMVMGNELPCLGIGPRRNASVLSDDASYLKEALQMDLTVAVADDGPQTATRRIMRYMRVLESVLRRGNIIDFFGSIGSPDKWGFALDCEHIYTQDIRFDGPIYLRDARLQATVTIYEGQ